MSCLAHNKAQHRLRNPVIFIAKVRNKIAKITPLCGRRYAAESGYTPRHCRSIENIDITDELMEVHK
jgi:hypothetical protein